jgi:hypothetical protein
VGSVRWRLEAFLREHGISIYRLHKALGGKVSKTGLYNITRGRTTGVEFELLAHVLEALESLTQKDLELADVLTYDKEGRTTQQ